MHAHPTPLLLPLVLLPLISAAVLGLTVRRRLPTQLVSWLACGSIAGAALLGWLGFFQLLGLEHHERALHQLAFPWIHVGTFHADFALLLDPLSATMVLVITNVGFLIHVYSTGYMAGDPGYQRFFAYLNLFVFAMLCLVLGDNLLVLFLGWEGVGLCSYLLIGFWFEERANAKAGKKAFVTNRVGDFGFALGMMLLFATFGTIVPTEINAKLAEGVPAGVSAWTLEAAALLMFLGATGKSAQIPLYVWLPDAMAGPTPVSALIHAATMVTAGVYMIARMNGLFFHAEFAMHVVLVIGAATALLAATIGLVQNDIKKVLAYSTVSQLGFMFAAMGAGAWVAGMFHLVTHAFFKACLFLGSGSVILAMHHEQDMRFYGGLGKSMTWTYRTFLVATLAIAGVPGLAGFFSKDEILWWAFASERGSPVVWALLAAAAFCTAFYMFRILWMTFWGEHRGNPAAAHGHGHDARGYDHEVDPGGTNHDHAHDHTHNPAADAHGGHHGPPPDPGRAITIPLIVLAALSLVGGYVGMPALFGVSNFFEHWLEPVFEHSRVPLRASMAHAHGTEWGLMGLSVGIAGAAILCTWLVWGSGKEKLRDVFAEKVPVLHRTLWNKWYMDELYEWALIGPIVWFSREVLWRIVDEVLVDGVVNGVAGACRYAAAGLGKLQDGDVGNYATAMVGGLLFLLLVMAGYGLW
jgi:NADH-quinone oxidoreductase subunit L